MTAGNIDYPDQLDIADAVTALALKTYTSLPKNGKPALRSNGVPEWTVLAGIVCQRDDSTLHCLSLATGVKCLPHDKVRQAKGVALHDSHAEILAIRGFNRFLLDEVNRIQTDSSYHSLWLQRNQGDGSSSECPPFTFNAVRIFLFLSSTPCGDASLEFLVEEPSRSVPWVIPPDFDGLMTYRGHEYLWQRGHVRFKPGRVDSPSTQSKSCSDKFALLSCISLLNTFLATLVNPSSCYLDYMVLPSSAYHRESFDRAFKRRLKSIPTEGWPPEFSVNYIEILTTQQILPSTLTRGKTFVATAPASILCVPGRPIEVMLNGVKMGSKFPPDAGAASCLCRAQFAKDFLDVVRQEMPLLYNALPTECTYAGLKQHVGEQRGLVKQSVRQALGGWVVNNGDGEFILGNLVPTGI